MMTVIVIESYRDVSRIVDRSRRFTIRFPQPQALYDTALRTDGIETVLKPPFYVKKMFGDCVNSSDYTAIQPCKSTGYIRNAFDTWHSPSAMRKEGYCMAFTAAIWRDESGPNPVTAIVSGENNSCATRATCCSVTASISDSISSKLV